MDKKDNLQENVGTVDASYTKAADESIDGECKAVQVRAETSGKETSAKDGQLEKNDKILMNEDGRLHEPITIDHSIYTKVGDDYLAMRSKEESQLRNERGVTVNLLKNDDSLMSEKGDAQDPIGIVHSSYMEAVDEYLHLRSNEEFSSVSGLDVSNTLAKNGQTLKNDESLIRKTDPEEPVGTVHPSYMTAIDDYFASEAKENFHSDTQILMTETSTAVKNDSFVDEKADHEEPIGTVHSLYMESIDEYFDQESKNDFKPHAEIGFVEKSTKNSQLVKTDDALLSDNVDPQEPVGTIHSSYMKIVDEYLDQESKEELFPRAEIDMAETSTKKHQLMKNDESLPNDEGEPPEPIGVVHSSYMEALDEYLDLGSTEFTSSTKSDVRETSAQYDRRRKNGEDNETKDSEFQRDWEELGTKHLCSMNIVDDLAIGGNEDDQPPTEIGGTNDEHQKDQLKKKEKK